MTNDRREAISRKIRALLSMTVENGASEAEAIAAAIKATKLMAEYDITMSEAEFRQESCIRRDYQVGVRAHSVVYLASTIASMCNVKVWRARSTSGAPIAFFGLERDTEMAVYFMDLFKNSMEAEWKRYETPANVHRAKYRLSFMMGMVNRLADRIREIITARNVEQNKISSGSYGALVVVKNAVVETEYAKIGLKLRKTPTRTVNVTKADAYRSGQDAGNRVNITTGIKGSSRVSGYIN